MKITINIKRRVLFPDETVRAALFCLAFVPSAYADSNIFLQCAQQYPGDDAARLKCYDRLAAPAPAPAVQKNIVPDEDAEASTPSASAPAPGTERSYLTRVWNLDNLSNRDPSKLGRLQPYRQNYLLVKKTNNPNLQPSSPCHRPQYACPQRHRCGGDQVPIEFQG